MKNSQLWEVLSALTPKDRKYFGRWVRSPFFNRNERLIRLLEYLEDCLSASSLPHPSRAKRRVFIHKDQPSDGLLRVAVSDLYKQLESYLVFQERAGSEASFQLDLGRAYRKRGLARHFQKAIKKAEAAREHHPHRHAEYLDNRFAVAFERYQEKSAGERVAEFNLQQLSDFADTAFIAQKLRLTCIALSHQTVYKADYDLGMLSAVLSEVERRGLHQLPAIGLYYFGYRLMAEPDEEQHFTRLKAMLLHESGKLPADEQRNLCLMALNYCIKKVNALSEQYYREAFDLYKFAVQQALLFENGQLSHFAFNNIVAIALKVGEVDWSDQFIQAYAPQLERKHRSSTVHLNLARVAYARRDYDEALMHLQGADYKDRINNLIAKVLQLKIFYELQEYDLVDAHLNALTTHIRRQRVMGYHRTNYLNMARYTRALLHLAPGDGRERELLRQSIESERILTEKEWLLSMLSQA